MIIIMKQGTTHEHVEELSQHIERWNVKANPIYGEDTIVIGLVGDTGAVDKDALMLDPQVENIIKVQEPFKLANRKFHPDNSVVEIAPGVVVGGKKLVVMAGPCSVESEEQIIDVAKHVQADGATVLRGGAWKPRSSPYSFQGLKAVAWTDTICSFVIIIGIWLIAIQFLLKVGGFTAMNEGIAALNPEFVKGFSVKIPPITALSWVVTWGICNFGAPQFVARFMSAESPEVASKSQGITGIGLLLFYVPLAITGLCGMLIHPGIEKQDMVFTTLVFSEVNPIIGAIMLASVVAAIISTADSLLLLIATTFAHDFYSKVKSNVSDKEELFVSRVSTIVFGIGAVALTFVMSDTIQIIQAKAVTLMGAAMAVPIMVGVAWKRANKISAMIAAAAGFVTALVWYGLGQPAGIMAALPACLVCFIVIMVGSVMTPESANESADKETMDHLFGETK